MQATDVKFGDERLPERFWSKVVQSVDGCWRWTASTNGRGYGQFGIGGRKGGNMLAHRFAYQALVGEIGDGAMLHHECKNKLCVLPAHLEQVGYREHWEEHSGDWDPRGAVRGNHNALPTHCKRGHEFNEANTRRRNRQRWCRACDRIRSARYKQERAA